MHKRTKLAYTKCGARGSKCPCPRAGKQPGHCPPVRCLDNMQLVQPQQCYVTTPCALWGRGLPHAASARTPQHRVRFLGLPWQSFLGHGVSPGGGRDETREVSHSVLVSSVVIFSPCRQAEFPRGLSSHPPQHLKRTPPFTAQWARTSPGWASLLTRHWAACRTTRAFFWRSQWRVMPWSEVFWQTQKGLRPVVRKTAILHRMKIKAQHNKEHESITMHAASVHLKGTLKWIYWIHAVASCCWNSIESYHCTGVSMFF